MHLARRLRYHAANFRAAGEMEKAIEYEETALMADRNIEELSAHGRRRNAARKPSDKRNMRLNPLR